MTTHAPPRQVEAWKHHVSRGGGAPGPVDNAALEGKSPEELAGGAAACRAVPELHSMLSHKGFGHSIYHHIMVLDILYCHIMVFETLYSVI